MHARIGGEARLAGEENAGTRPSVPASDSEARVRTLPAEHHDTPAALSEVFGLAARHFVATILSQSSAYCCLYGGQIFSSATRRNDATSAALTFMPRASRISLALARLSTLSVASRILEARGMKVNA